MSRPGLLIALPVCVAVIVVAVLLATGSLLGSSKDTTAGSAPACLPNTLSHSAKLAGLPVDVTPAPETDTANPDTQISFLGVPVTQIRNVSVSAQRSGSHAGRLRAYSQGDGASFVPAKPFVAGERVMVRAMIEGKSTSFHFQIDTPYSTASVHEFPNPQATPADYQSFVSLPGVQAPILSVIAPDRDPAAGDVLTTNGPGPGRYGPLIYTPQGRLVWFDQLPKNRVAENLSVQDYEGQRDLTFWQGKVLSLGFGQGEDIVMNDNYQVVARVHGGNGLQADLHDFQISKHDVSYTTAFNSIHCDLSSLEGVRNGVIVDNAVQEIDMKTGLVRFEWHSLDHVSASESETAPPKKPTPWDWFHINSIDPQANGDIFISARSTWAGYQLQAGSGKILWRLGGTNSSFKMGPGTKTAWQHDGRILPDGEVTLFDDGSNPPIHSQSRAVRIALDFKAHTATLRSVYTHPSPLLSASQGNMQTLPDGNAVVGYGGIPEVSEYAKNGELLFDAQLPLAFSSYRSFRFPWSGRPLSPPAVAANLNNTSEETIVHMSWNGATEVAAWRVLAGERPASLSPHETLPASAFESSAILTKKYVYVAVQALNAAGAVLKSSATARVAKYASAYPTNGQSG